MNQILEAVEDVNYRQKRVIVDKVIKRFGEDLSGKILQFGDSHLNQRPMI